MWKNTAEPGRPRMTQFFLHYCLLAIRTKLYTIHIKFTVLWANEMSFKAWGGLISSDIILHNGTRFYSPLRSHGQIRLSRFGFLTSTKLMANWFLCSCNRWKCLSTLFWRCSFTVVMLRSAWSVWFETYRGAPAISLNVLDWNLWMMFTFDLLQQPHNSMP